MKHNYFKHLFMTLLLLCTTVASAHDFEVGGIYYNITDAENKTVEVSYRGSKYYEYSDEYIGSVVIPERATYNGITYSVASIGDDAFNGCFGLTSVVIPNSITIIRCDAFKDCLGLTCVEYNAMNCTTMGSHFFPVFSGCTALSVVTIGEHVKAIPANAFYGCSGLISIEIPNSVKSIGGSAFEDCSALTSVVIPTSVTSIGGGGVRRLLGSYLR